MASMKAPSAASRSSPFAAAPMAVSHAPAGTFAPGTKVQVGSHRVMVQKYLSEGGFAHVYVAQIISPDPKGEVVVLKRVAVPDKDELANMRTEVETMKKLKGHKHIVTYIDSHASQLKGGGYEVFLLMEYCAGGGLIDFMNTRLKNRLTEPEILKIFSDAAEGVACMHYLKPPLLHRDLKVENILISTSSSSKVYKLCDFGSTAPPRPAATNAAEGKLIEEDVQRHTTLQYRSPEMIDVYRKRPIDEKSDIWALGVLLYKLCYYTTPFEEQGQMAILSAKFKYPAYPPFSDRLKRLIAIMLMENPQRRPNVYEVLKETCSIRGVEVPVKDIYANRTPSESRRNQQLPPLDPDARAPPIGAQIAAPERQVQSIPSVTPMRRGRPTSTTQHETKTKPSPSPGVKTSGDPFAALDSQNQATRAAAVDELSGRFPALDDFSLLHNKDSGFKFDQHSGPQLAKQTSTNDRVTHALADEAFKSTDVKVDTSSTKLPSTVVRNTPPTKSKPVDVPVIKTVASPPLEQRESQKPAMVSVGTMTSRPASPDVLKPPKTNDRPIWRVPSPGIKPSLSPLPSPRTDAYSSKRQTIADPTVSSFTYSDHASPKSPVSSRPSLETIRTGALDVPDTLHRSRSANSRPTEDKHRLSRQSPDLRSESLPKQHPNSSPRQVPVDSLIDTEPYADETNIASDVDFLRAKESEEAFKNQHRRTSSLRHLKNASISGVSSLTGTKSMLAGRFGDTFRRFENNRQSPRNSMVGRQFSEGEGNLISPIDADEDPVLPLADDEDTIDETEDLSPEVRRELERRRLSQEERRVTQAAAAYRQQLASGEPQKISRASAIQSRVKSLLDESGRQTPVTKTASGYGRFTNVEDTTTGPKSGDMQHLQPTVAHKPIAVQSTAPAVPAAASSSAPPRTSSLPSQQDTIPTRTAASIQKTLPARPSAPPKPQNLRTGGPNPPSVRSGDGMQDMSAAENADVESDFRKRYPDLSIEMVETEIEKAPPQRALRPTGMRIREV